VVDQAVQELQSRGIRPVEVLHHQTDGLPFRLLEQPLQHRFQGLLPLLLWREAEGRVMVFQWQREQRSKQRDVRLPGQPGMLQRPLQPLQLLLRGVFSTHM
jgi:hypothetical protein